MRHVSRLLPSIAFCALTISAYAQEYFDLTDHYVVNADFSSNVHYDASSTGDVKNVIENINGWTRDINSTTTNTVVATFQYGTEATFFGVPIPATGPDGTAEGNCLTLCAASKKDIILFQRKKLPAGNYMLIVTSYNCNTKTVGQSLSGWWQATAEQQLSSTAVFPAGEWQNDTIRFQLTDLQSGRIQIGLQAATGRTTSSAMLVIDRVRLLRDTPLGPEDEQAPAPNVVTDPRFARGATMAFGRILSVSGDDIQEQGFCWSTCPSPTLSDSHTTRSLNNNGPIYWLQDLEPATRYYMRAFAVDIYGNVGYGDDIKIYTLPRGQITFNMRTSGDDNSTRIKNAAQTAIDWWNALTEMKGYAPNIGYNGGVPTAECSYGGWMSVGSNTSYQKPGTIMHEMLHGCGVIPWNDTEWSRHVLRSDIDGSGRGTGQWLGDRVTEVLRFWDNNPEARLNGDYQHMWPYGINGANEDNGSDVLYIGNGLVCQALGEDGLQHTSASFAEPYYALNQEDDTKFFIQSENHQNGLDTSFLVNDANDNLAWRKLSPEEAAQNDSAAWQVTFTPNNQYYQLRNNATQKYITYNNGFKTQSRRAYTTANEDFHLMRGRIDVNTTFGTKRGYWVIHPTNNWNPPCLTATAAGSVGSSTFNISNDATAQRWIFFTAKELGVEHLSAIVSHEADVQPAFRTGIFTIDGRRLQPHPRKLQPGIYIINGHKTFIH